MARKKLNLFKPSEVAEKQFYRQLKKVAEASGHIVERHADGAKINYPKEMMTELEKYSEKLGPWAIKQAAKLVDYVQRSNKRAYKNKAKNISEKLKEDRNVIETAQLLMFEQVELIKSIPIEAGLRAQKIAFEAALSGTRAEVNEDTVKELQKQMGMSTQVARNRALVIARTETARATALINQSRAMAVGSRQYVWHNSGDAAVRPAHKTYRGKKLDGMIFSWDNPPTLDDGTTIHPGQIYNCRCFASPIFEDE